MLKNNPFHFHVHKVCSKRLFSTKKLVVHGKSPFYETMTKSRRLFFRDRFTFSFAELAGHSSFILLAISYLESNPYYLRGVAIAGITSMTVFQYFRPSPLWLPIKWNVLFIGINVGMIAKLLFDERMSDINLNESQRDLYNQVFRPAGVSLIDFFALITKAKVVKDVPALTDLAVQNSKQNTIGIIISGDVSVTTGTSEHPVILNTLSTYQFFGEMAFLSYQQQVEEETPTVRRLASANVTTKTTCTIMYWEYDTLLLLLKSNAKLSRCMQTILATDLMRKVTSQNEKKSSMKNSKMQHPLRLAV